MKQQFAAAGYQFATHSVSLIGKHVDVPYPHWQRPTMVDETLNQVSLTRGAFTAARRLKKQILISSYAE